MSAALVPLAAALISAFVAVVGLIISKENKVSEFRQQWIDGLRDDVSALIGAVSANVIGHHDSESARILVTTAREYRSRIRLRFKKDDDEAETLLLALDRLVKSAESFGYDGGVMSGAEQLQLATQDILKNEWERVKAGEPRYRKTLRLSFRAAVAAGSALGVAALIALFNDALIPAFVWFISQFKG